MIAHDAPIRWAANAPSAALLAEALREALPPTRMVEIADQREDSDEPAAPARRIWRIWPLDAPPLLLKRYADPHHYRTELCNLRFFNAVARAHTPRLLACDGAATALLVEDCDGPTVASTDALGSLAAQHAWERVLVALATLHARAERQLPLLRRLYAPAWPGLMGAPPADLLESAMDAVLTALQLPPLAVSERGILIAAGSWLHARLNVAAAHYRAPIAGLLDARSIVLTPERVVFMDMGRPVLGLQPVDMLCTWRRADRRVLIEHSYLAERRRIGAPVASELFWELDALLMVAACARRLHRIALLAMAPAAIGAAAGDCIAALVDAARRIAELRGLDALLARRAVG